MTAKIAVFLFVLTAGASNTIFAWGLSSDPIGRCFWVAIAVASALYTTQALSVLARQLTARAWWRAAAAVVLACATLGYDVLAAYGLSAAEQSRLSFTTERDTSQLSAARRDLVTAERALAVRSDVPPTVEAKGRLAACRRDCAAHKAVLAAAEGRDALRAEVDHLRAALTQMRAPAAGDKRSALIGPELAAWLPVLIVTLGSLLGGFSASAAPKPDAVAAPETPEPAPVAAPEQIAPDAHPLVPKLRRVAENPPDGIHIAEGWIVGSQRKLATAIGTAPSRLNAQLRDAAESGAIELRTDGGTAVRLN